MFKPNLGHSGGNHCSLWVGDRNAPYPGQLPLTGQTRITNLKVIINPIFMDWGRKVNMWGHFWPSQFGGMCWKCTMTLILNTVSIISPFIIITNTSSSSNESSHQLCWNLSPSCLMMCLILLNCLIKQCWEMMWEWGNAERQVAKFENEKHICWQTSLNLDVSARRKESWEQLFIKSTAALQRWRHYIPYWISSVNWKISSADQLRPSNGHIIPHHLSAGEAANQKLQSHQLSRSIWLCSPPLVLLLTNCSLSVVPSLPLLLIIATLWCSLVLL